MGQVFEDVADDRHRPDRRSSKLHTTEAQYELLRGHITAGQFPPGAVLLETVLSKQYGVSRTPVREALGRLAQDGLVVRLARGFQVRIRGPEEILEIYETRIALESTCTAFAATRRTEFELAQLDYVLDLRRREKDPSRFGKLNNQWHILLRTAAHNDTTFTILERLDSQLEIYRPKKGLRGPRNLALEEHAAILEAVRDQRSNDAEMAMRQHLIRARDQRVESFLLEARRDSVALPD